MRKYVFFKLNFGENVRAVILAAALISKQHAISGKSWKSMDIATNHFRPSQFGRLHSLKCNERLGTGEIGPEL